METENFELYPILHKGRIYNILTEMDMSFHEVRAMIDWLDAKGAFPRVEGEGVFDGTDGPGESPESGELPESGALYSCPVEGAVFEVDVQGFDIVVYRREPAA